MLKCPLWRKFLCFVGNHPTLTSRRIGLRHVSGRISVYKITECPACGRVVGQYHIGDVRALPSKK